MENVWEFRYSVPRRPKAGAGPSTEEVEKTLLEGLAKSGGQPTQCLWDLAQFYKRSKQPDKALDYLRQLLALPIDPESRANCMLALGQMAEERNDYRAAVRYYKAALSLEPTNNGLWYFINNNLAVSLNALRHFAEGERYSRKALGVDGERPNAHKNLGIALESQGRFSEAAKCFIEATRADASDPGALNRLEKLLADHPSLAAEFVEQAELCRKAVGFAAAEGQKVMPGLRRKAGGEFEPPNRK